MSQTNPNLSEVNYVEFNARLDALGLDAQGFAEATGYNAQYVTDATLGAKALTRSVIKDLAKLEAQEAGQRVIAAKMRKVANKKNLDSEAPFSRFQRAVKKAGSQATFAKIAGSCLSDVSRMSRKKLPLNSATMIAVDKVLEAPDNFRPEDISEHAAVQARRLSALKSFYQAQGSFEAVAKALDYSFAYVRAMVHGNNPISSQVVERLEEVQKSVHGGSEYRTEQERRRAVLRSLVGALGSSMAVAKATGYDDQYVRQMLGGSDPVSMPAYKRFKRALAVGSKPAPTAHTASNVGGKARTVSARPSPPPVAVTFGTSSPATPATQIAGMLATLEGLEDAAARLRRQLKALNA